MNSYPSYCCWTWFRPWMHIFCTWRRYCFEFTENHHVGETALMLIFYYCTTNTKHLLRLPTARNLQTPKKFVVMIQRHTTRVTLSNLINIHLFYSLNQLANMIREYWQHCNTHTTDLCRRISNLCHWSRLDVRYVAYYAQPNFWGVKSSKYCGSGVVCVLIFKKLITAFETLY